MSDTILTAEQIADLREKAEQSDRDRMQVPRRGYLLTLKSHEALRAERDAAEGQANLMAALYREAEAEGDAALAALRDYGQHQWHCNSRATAPEGQHAACSCGFRRLLGEHDG